MDGIQIDSSAIDGVLTGVGFSIDTFEATMNNQYLWTLAVMFIGVAIVLGLVIYLLTGHRRVGGGLSPMGRYYEGYKAQGMGERQATEWAKLDYIGMPSNSKAGGDYFKKHVRNRP